MLDSLSDRREKSFFLKCPECGTELVEKESRYGKFLSCLRFPSCKFTYDLSKGQEIPKKYIKY